MSGREIYIEVIGIGQALRVAAVDAETGEELVFQVPRNTSRSEIDNLARAKIRWKLERDAEQKKRPDTGSGRGITV
ncbi:hypothetical protein [Maricaulis sp.]|uniref:DUF6898 family protein n=1 Tax=Maricaulis sp. TaxID=1486257 RepID=UPI0026252F31|nr:hypothetical protein [Maricaulis sp.]